MCLYLFVCMLAYLNDILISKCSSKLQSPQGLCPFLLP